jgi:hypothetical protein
VPFASFDEGAVCFVRRRFGVALVGSGSRLFAGAKGTRSAQGSIARFVSYEFIYTVGTLRVSGRRSPWFSRAGVGGGKAGYGLAEPIHNVFAARDPRWFECCAAESLSFGYPRRESAARRLYQFHHGMVGWFGSAVDAVSGASESFIATESASRVCMQEADRSKRYRLELSWR